MQTKQLSLPLSAKCLLAAGMTALAVTQARADYSSTVLADAPKAYYRFNDSTNRDLLNLNYGSLGAAGNASNDLASITGGVVHSIPGAIVGDSDRAEFFDYTARTEIPFNAALNTPNTQPFTVEAWMYPATDQGNVGMGALCNRWTQGGNRQGWVMYQRAPNTNSSAYTSGPGLGWEFRMYNDLDGSTHLDVQSLVPFTLGKWQHVVVVYNPVGGDPLSAVLSIYIDGVFANAVTNTTGVAGYGPCTGNHDPGQAVNGQPAMSLGGYNNANSGTAGFANPWFGGVDEFAWYSNALSPAQILAHYQNGTNANRSQSYPSLIKAANPVAYLRLDEVAPNVDIANNLGDLRSSGIATNTAAVVHPATGPLAGPSGSGAFSYHLRNNNSQAPGSATTDLPWNASNNPGANTPFTFETWVRATSDRQNPGAAPVNNRYVSSGHRTGWVIFQRAPDASYSSASGYSGVGWNFRMYDGVTGSGQDITTGVDYTPGVWQHLVFTWEPQLEIQISPSGNDQWSGILTAYVNGVPVATNANALYAANVNPTEDGSMPADLAVGSYNAASGLGANPFEGDVAQLALYPNIVLTPAQIAAHYQAATNPNYGTNYASLVYAGGFLDIVNGSGLSQERSDLPSLYLPLNDPAYFAATNRGTLGSVADGSLVLTTNITAGPQSPTFAGFESFNESLPLDGLSMFASLNNPAGLNISGQITLEAWIQPSGSTPGTEDRIISHGPETISTYLAPSGDHINAITNTSEVFLRIDTAGPNYSVGSAQYSDATQTTTVNAATYPVPPADLLGTAWVHLVGTYDGSKWNLYRNGLLVASQASATGALPVGSNGNWAIGATGMGWADNFAGNVDEAAIYDKALTPAQVAAHWVAGNAGTANLSIVPAPGGKVTITWPAGTTLQQSATVKGTYAPVPGSPTSPLTISATAAKFYRWSLP